MPAMPVVYIDVVWFVNLVMDALLLWMTGWLMKRKIRWYRILFGALFGASYALLLFFPSLSMLTTWPGKAIVSVAMVWMALPRKNVLDVLRLVGIYYFVSFVLAGATVALGFAIPGTSLRNALAVGPRSLMFVTSGETLALMVAIPLCIFGIQRLIARIARVHRQANWLCSVLASFETGDLSFTGLVDSGNQLYDPVSHQPVSFVDLDVLLPILPMQLQRELAQGRDMLSAIASVAVSNQFTLVPFQGAGGKGLTIAVRATEVRVEWKGQSHVVLGKQLFAVYPGKLSADGSFRAILHMDMMNGDDDVEGVSDAQRHEHETTHSIATTLYPHSSEVPRQPR